MTCFCVSGSGDENPLVPEGPTPPAVERGELASYVTADVTKEFDIICAEESIPYGMS